MSAPESISSTTVVIDALTLAKSAAARDYAFRQRRLSRLTGMVVSDQPALDVNLQFELQGGKPLIHGRVGGAVELICQRCMQPMQFELNEQFSLLVCDTDELSTEDEDAEIEVTVNQWDEWLADATRIDVVELIEEQVILALPLVPRHDDKLACIAVIDGSQTTAEDVPDRIKEAVAATNDDVGMRRPFANLRELLNK